MARTPRQRNALLVEVLRFLTVGGLGYIVDVGLSNLLVYGLFGLVPAIMAGSPLKAKIISTVVSVVVAWLGNRLWTYGARQTGSNLRGILLFFLVNAVGMVIAVIPLGITWYLLELRDPVSYNLSTNVVGIGLAMVFRFYAYRTWVFREQPQAQGAQAVELDPDAQPSSVPGPERSSASRRATGPGPGAAAPTMGVHGQVPGSEARPELKGSIWTSD